MKIFHATMKILISFLTAVKLLPSDNDETRTMVSDHFWQELETSLTMPNLIGFGRRLMYVTILIFMKMIVIIFPTLFQPLILGVMFDGVFRLACEYYPGTF